MGLEKFANAILLSWTRGELISGLQFDRKQLQQAGLRWRGEGKDEEIQVLHSQTIPFHITPTDC